jgi:hypothetical protein
MFPYDAKLAAAAQVSPQSIPAVLQLMQTIDNTCVDGDGLKWFNRLYLQVTQAVENRVAAGGFSNPAWFVELDVQFANLYFNALSAALTGPSYPAPCSGCWQALFSCRNQTRTARIQFAVAGMNAHINHDLPLAVLSTCKTEKTIPRHGTAQYNGYTSIDATLDTLIDTAKQELNVRLLGDPLPAVSHLEDLLAAWNLAAAREQAWTTAECLWNDSALAAKIRMDAIDGLTTVIGKALLIPVP